MTHKKRKRQRGFSLIEVVLASSVLTVVVAGSMAMQNYTTHRTVSTSDKAFATQKALQMFEELRSYVQANRESDIAKLQNFSDGANYNQVLTTEKIETSSGTGTIALDLTNPADPLSANPRADGVWKYVRQVQVRPVANDDNARYVTVSVFYADKKNNNQPVSGPPLATLAGILKTNISQDTPTQVYDLFIIAMENAPSWWVDLADLRPSFERTLIDLEQRNPGLVFRRHFVTHFGFGRDPYYMPYINSANTIDAQKLPFAYLYPGRINHALNENYVLGNINGRRRDDSSTDFLSINKRQDSDNPNPSYGIGVDYRDYSLADQFNHVMRYPEQKAMEDRLIQATGETNPLLYKESPSLVTFLEDLNTSSKYKNSIVINLHGELLPVPAIRNYSDPAKAPDLFAQKLDKDPTHTAPGAGLTLPGAGADNTDFTSLRYKRVVTHPENLRYDNPPAGGTPTSDNNSTIRWRVYSYEEIPTGQSALPISSTFNDTTRDNDTIPQISLFIPTIGKGPSYTGVANAGTLNYPSTNLGNSFAPADPKTWITGTLKLERLVGNDNKAYSWWSSGGSGVENIVMTHDFAKPNGSGGYQVNITPAASQTQTDTGAAFINDTYSTALTMAYDRAANSIPVSSTVVVNSTQIDLMGPMTDQNKSDLLNTLIVLDGGTDKEEVVRVTSVDNVPNGSTSGLSAAQITALTNANKNRRLTINRGLKFNHSAMPGFPVSSGTPFSDASLTTSFNTARTSLVTASVGNSSRVSGVTAATAAIAPITRHKDYDVKVIDDVMFGSAEQGIRVILYDTPTRQPRYSTNNTGLDPNYQLDGLEYIPAPVNTTTFNAATGMAATDSLANTNQNVYKNTARWRVNLNTSSFSNSIFNPFASSMVPLETRMVGYRDDMFATPANPLPTGCTPTLNELCDGIWGDGDAYVPNSGSGNQHETQMRKNLYNVSRSYVYMGYAFTDVDSTTTVTGSPTASYRNSVPANTLVIPKTEQAQFMGNPLLNPYLDVKRLNRFNRHFIDYSGNPSGLAGFNAATGPAWDKDNVDLNWLFNLYSTGIMRSNSIYNSITGFSNYYYANGGELGTDGTNATFSLRTQPWSDSVTGTATVDNQNTAVREILQDGGGNGGARVIMDTSSPSANRWRANPFRGEMFPDDELAFWRNNGNLPTLDYASANNAVSGSTPPLRSYYRAPTIANPRPWPSAGGANTHRRMGETGAPGFLNGTSDSNPYTSNTGLTHISTSGNAILTNNPGDAGRQLVDSFNVILADKMNSTRPYIINSSNGKSGAYTSNEMKGIRNRLSFINTTTGAVSSSQTTQNVYYRHDTDLTNRTASAILRLTRPDPANPTSVSGDTPGMVGYALVNGLAASGETGVLDMARFTQTGTLQTFMDAGDRNVPGVASGRTVQLPRVKVTEPRSSQVYVNPTTIPVNFNVSWLRWNDEKYSPAYPNNWYDSTKLVYNIKYSPDNKRSWLYAGTNVKIVSNPPDPADIPQFYDHYNTSYNVAGGPETVMASLDKTWSWNVSSLPKGNYVLRVEAYRVGFDTGWSYHDVFVTIDR